MHIDNDDLIRFDNGTMTTQEVIEFLSHLDHCDSCLDQLTVLENGGNTDAPSYLAEQILSKADSCESQFTMAASKTSRKILFLRYSLQTAAGVAAALILLFSVPNINFSDLNLCNSAQTERSLPERENNRLYHFTRNIGQSISDSTGSLTKSLSEFSSKIMNGGK